MNVKFELDYLKLLAAAERSPKLAHEAMVLALGKSAREVQTLARAKHRFRSKTTMLEKSVEFTVDKREMNATVFLNEKVASYGPFVHDGTGIYGPAKRKLDPIVPRGKRYRVYKDIDGNKVKRDKFKQKEWLRFIGSDGRFHFARQINHPGIKPDQFLYKAADAAQSQINVIFAHALDDFVAKFDRQIGGN